MQIKKIFLASSAELKADREAFERMLARLNPQWRSRDITFDLVVWENFIDAMSSEGLQKEYDKAVQECDVFVMLFFTKVDYHKYQKYTKWIMLFSLLLLTAVIFVGTRELGARRWRNSSMPMAQVKRPCVPA